MRLAPTTEQEALRKELRDYFAGMVTGTLILTFGGGTNEVQRDIIAMIGLDMPRAPR